MNGNFWDLVAITRMTEMRRKADILRWCASAVRPHNTLHLLPRFLDQHAIELLMGC